MIVLLGHCHSPSVERKRFASAGEPALQPIEDVHVEVETETVDIDFLLNSIQELPDRYRLVFNLYVLDGYSHKEVSEMLEITTGTTKSNLARARKILKEKVESYMANLNSQSL